MARFRGNKAEVTIYLTKETFEELEACRNPLIPMSTTCAMIIAEVLSFNREDNKETATN